MNLKTTYALFAALVLVLLVSAIVLMTGSPPGEENLLLPSAKALKLKADDVKRVVIEKKRPKEETFIFTREGKAWRMEKPAPARADASAVDRLIDDLLSARRDPKSQTPPTLKDAGLDPPSVVVKLSHGEGAPLVVNLGTLTPGANPEVFATSSDRAKAFSIRKGSLSALLGDNKDATSAGDLVKSAADFRAKELWFENAGFNPSDAVQRVELAGGQSQVVLVRGDNGWRYEKPEGFGPADAQGTPSEGPDSSLSGVGPLVLKLAAIKPAGAEDLVDAKEYATFGLETEKPASGKFTVVRKGDGGKLITESLLIGNKDGGKYFVRRADDTTVAKVPASAVDPVLRVLERPAALRDRQLFDFSPTAVDAVDVRISSEDKPIELRKIGGVWKLFDTDGGSQPANVRNVTALLTPLAGRPVKDFPDPNASDASLGFDRPNAELTLWLGGILPDEKKEEKKDEKAKAGEKAAPAPPAKPKLSEPTARLLIGKRDKDLLYVRRLTKDKVGKETKADFAIAADYWPTVMHVRLDYIDPTLPSFVTAQAQKLTVYRAGQEVAFEKQDKGDWIIKQPPALAGRPADPVQVEKMLNEMAIIDVIRPWTEKPNDRDLERYGLKNPKLQATVVSKAGDKTNELTVSVGNETDDKSAVYFRLSGRDLVFTAAPKAFEQLRSGDYRDLQIYHLDRDKVVGLKITGWKDVLGAPAMREFERKSASNWSMKGEGAVKVDPLQAESFLNNVSNVRAVKFVADHTGPKDEHKLTPAAGALEIQILVEGEKEPVTLTLGATTENNYYATSSRAPGDVFLLPKAAFEELRARPGYFAAK